MLSSFLHFFRYLPFPSEKHLDYHELSNKKAFNEAFSCLELRGSKFMYKRAYYEVKSSLQFGRLCTTPTLDNAMDYEETEEEIEIISKFKHLLKKIKKKKGKYSKRRRSNVAIVTVIFII